jgi:hypothetical protein
MCDCKTMKVYLVYKCDPISVGNYREVVVTTLSKENALREVTNRKKFDGWFSYEIVEMEAD